MKSRWFLCWSQFATAAAERAWMDRRFVQVRWVSGTIGLVYGWVSQEKSEKKANIVNADEIGLKMKSFRDIMQARPNPGS